MPKNRDYVPAGDGEFNDWVEQLSTFLAANAGPLGVTAAQATEITNAVGAWGSAYNNARQLQQAAETAVNTKNDQREALLVLIRPLMRFIQNRPQTTDAQRQGLGITVPDRSRSRVSAPESRPLVQIDASQRLAHTLVLRDEGSPARGKPEGAEAAEVWCSLTDVNVAPPADPTQCQLVAVSRRNVVKLDFTGAEAGKNAHYMVRWVNSRGEKGPWSETGSATVAA